jgi:hypothetical protein
MTRRFGVAIPAPTEDDIARSRERHAYCWALLVLVVLAGVGLLYMSGGSFYGYSGLYFVVLVVVAGGVFLSVDDGMAEEKSQTELDHVAYCCRELPKVREYFAEAAKAGREYVLVGESRMVREYEKRQRHTLAHGAIFGGHG